MLDHAIIILCAILNEFIVSLLLLPSGHKTVNKLITSNQDGGVGRHTVPPRTTKRRTTTNLKTKNNQNSQKIELYGSPTTKESKKKHSSRPVGGVETGSRVERTHSKAVAGRPGGPTFTCR